MPFVSVEPSVAPVRSASAPKSNHVPSFNGRRGQPVVPFVLHHLKCAGDIGGRILHSHPESVMMVEVGDEAIHWDVDTQRC